MFGISTNRSFLHGWTAINMWNRQTRDESGSDQARCFPYSNAFIIPDQTRHKQLECGWGMVCGDYVLASGSTRLRNHKNLVVLNWGAKSLRINLPGKFPRCLQRCCFIPQTCGHMGGSYNGGIQMTHVGVSIQLDGTLNGKSREKKGGWFVGTHILGTLHIGNPPRIPTRKKKPLSRPGGWPTSVEGSICTFPRNSGRWKIHGGFLWRETRNQDVYHVWLGLYSQNMGKLNMFQTIDQMMFIDFPIQFVILGAHIIVYNIFCFWTRLMPNFYTASNLLSGKKST